MAVLVVGIAGAGGYRAALALKGRSENADVSGGLEPATDSLQFGEVWEDTQFLWTVPITNRRAQDIEIERFVTSCTCSQVEPRTLVIPAGQTREIRLTLDLISKRSQEAPWPVSDFEMSISPRVKGDEGGLSPIWWTIRGRVRSAIRFDTPFADVGRKSELGQPLPPAQMAVKVLPTVRSLTATSSSPQFGVGVRRSPDVSDHWEVVVTPRGTLPRGEVRCSVAIVPS
jgi:hypothetical protein